MKKFTAFVFAVCLLLTACEEEKYVAGPTKTESGTIVQTVFAPDRHGSDVNVGITFKGDLAITPVSVNLPAKWAVVIECQHGGKFILDSERHEIAKGVWQKVNAGDKVSIQYREIYKVVTEDDKEKSRTFEKYETLAVTKL